MELLGSCRRLTLFQQCKYFQQTHFNFSGTVPAIHFMLQDLTPSLEKFGNRLNKRMNVLDKQYLY